MHAMNRCYCRLHLPYTTCCCPLQNNQYTLYLVAIVDCTHIGSATASGLVPLHMDMVAVDNEREIHKPNSEHEACGGRNRRHKMCVDDTYISNGFFLFLFFALTGQKNGGVVNVY